MNAPVDFTQWQPIELDGSEPGDQERDLDNGCRAQIGPEHHADPRRAWSWTIINGDDEVDGGPAPGEDEAKAAVSQWERKHPEGL